MSCFIFGHFAVAAGRQATTQNAKTKKNVTHSFYDSVLHSADDDVPSQIRTYSGNTPCLSNDTILWLFGKLACASASEALIDVITSAPVPGDPSDPEYEARIPDLPYPHILITGTIEGAAITNGAYVTHIITTQEHVRNTRMPSKFAITFDTSLPRWRFKPDLKPGAAVQVLGRFAGIAAPTRLAEITPEHIVLALPSSVGATQPAQDAPDSASPARVSKFRSPKKPKPAAATETTSTIPPPRFIPSADTTAVAPASEPPVAGSSKTRAGTKRKATTQDEPDTPTQKRKVATQDEPEAVMPKVIIDEFYDH